MVYDPPSFLNQKTPVGKPHYGYTSVISHYDSLEAFLGHLRAREGTFDKDTLKQHGISKPAIASEFVIRQLRKGGRNNSGGPVFNMCKTFDDAVRLAEYGWPEGRERVAEKNAEIRNLMRDIVEAPAFHHDLIGEEVDVPEFLMGTPEHMVGFDIVQTRHKFLRITVDVNSRCDACGRRAHDAEPNPPEWAMVRGAVVSLLAQALIRYGFQVEVVVGAVAFHREGWFLKKLDSRNHYDYDKKRIGAIKHTTSVVIHRPGWQFDFDRLVFATAHEGFMRKLLYRHEEGFIFEKLGNRYPLDLGMNSDPQVVGTVPLDVADKPENMPEMGESDIHLDSYPVMSDRLGEHGAKGAFATVQAGAAWLLARLKEAGITFR